MSDEALAPARRRLADALQELNETLLNTEHPADALDSMADKVQALVRTAQAAPPRRPSLPERSPIMGFGNSAAIPLEIDQSDPEALRAHVVLGTTQEGPDGRVHGGVVASMFDLVLALAHHRVSEPGFTGTLTVRYLLAAPVRTRLDFECRAERISARKVRAWGTLTAEGAVRAEADAVFILPRRD